MNIPCSDLIENIWPADDGYLLGTMTIMGALHHVAFIRVKYDDNGTQVADAGPLYQEMMDKAYEAGGGDGPWVTMQLPVFVGDWICIITPDCR